jgi:hypothetical protein
MSDLPNPISHMSARSPEGGVPAKNMADIARLFLDGARPISTPPQRLSPKDRAATPTPPSTPHPSTTLAASRMPQPKKNDPSFSLPPTLLGLTGQTGDTAWALLLTAAAKLAEEHATTICLIGERNHAFVFELLGQESTEDAPRIIAGAGTPDLQIARALYTLRDSVGTWLIAAPDARNENFPTLATHAAHRLIACSTDGDSLIGAYQHMKRAAALIPATQTSHAFIIAPTPAASTDAHTRLQKAAREFLHHPLPFAGTAPQAQGTGGGSRLATITMKPTDRTAIWAAITDELCAPDPTETDSEETPRPRSTDIESLLEHVTSASAELHHHSTHASAASHAVFDQLSHVLDPEERAALSADLDPLEEDYAPIIEPATIKSAPALQTPTPQPQKAQGLNLLAPLEPTPTAPPAQKPPTYPLTLRAFDLLHPTDNTRAAQWQAVESSIPDLLPRAILLDARPPLSWASDCCIALDPAGRLHVWTLYKDGVSWFALREWAAEHRNLLALTRRDLPVSPTTDVAIHIVLPLELDGPSPDIQTLLRTPNPSLLLYRLRPLQWNTRQGILVVPIA